MRKQYRKGSHETIQPEGLWWSERTELDTVWRTATAPSETNITQIRQHCSKIYFVSISAFVQFASPSKNTLVECSCLQTWLNIHFHGFHIKVLAVVLTSIRKGMLPNKYSKQQNLWFVHVADGDINLPLYYLLTQPSPFISRWLQVRPFRPKTVHMVVLCLLSTLRFIHLCPRAATIFHKIEIYLVVPIPPIAFSRSRSISFSRSIKFSSVCFFFVRFPRSFTIPVLIRENSRYCSWAQIIYFCFICHGN